MPPKIRKGKGDGRLPSAATPRPATAKRGASDTMGSSLPKKKAKDRTDGEVVDDLFTSIGVVPDTGNVVKPSHKDKIKKVTSRQGRAEAREALRNHILSYAGVDKSIFKLRDKRKKEDLGKLHPQLLNELETLNLLNELIGDDQATTSGGAGALGFTRDHMEKLKENDGDPPGNFPDDIRRNVLGKDVKDIKDKYKKARDSGSAEEETSAREEIQRHIKRVDYGKKFKDECHAIGPGIDVVAMSMNADGNMTGAAPYSELAEKVDALQSEWSTEEITAQIAKYTGLTIPGVPPENLDPPMGMDDEEFARVTFPLREMATIMLAEKGRELKRAGEAKSDDKKLIEKALITASKEGFHETFFKNAKKNAIFAQKGGQNALRKEYGL